MGILSFHHPSLNRLSKPFCSPWSAVFKCRSAHLSYERRVRKWGSDFCAQVELLVVDDICSKRTETRQREGRGEAREIEREIPVRTGRYLGSRSDCIAAAQGFQ